MNLKLPPLLVTTKPLSETAPLLPCMGKGKNREKKKLKRHNFALPPDWTVLVLAYSLQHMFGCIEECLHLTPSASTPSKHKRQRALKSNCARQRASQSLWPHSGTPGVGVAKETAGCYGDECFAVTWVQSARQQGREGVSRGGGVRWRKMLRWGTQEGRKVARTGCERGESSWEKGETCYTCGGKKAERMWGEERKRVTEKKQLPGSSRR